ncbi:hypothetical protein BC826DRAFT_1066330 [Russula brevipes]|nr:hypothetical protein BC826DRAFT_1066330 [Russula brevipes]
MAGHHSTWRRGGDMRKLFGYFSSRARIQQHRPRMAWHHSRTYEQEGVIILSSNSHNTKTEVKLCTPINFLVLCILRYQSTQTGAKVVHHHHIFPTHSLPVLSPGRPVVLVGTLSCDMDPSRVMYVQTGSFLTFLALMPQSFTTRLSRFLQLPPRHPLCCPPTKVLET